MTGAGRRSSLDTAPGDVDGRYVRAGGPAVAALRGLALAGVALLLAALVLPWRPSTSCLLRAATGIPCPLCGGTTALVRLGDGSPLAALRASPLVTLGVAAWVLTPLAPGPLRQRLLHRVAGRRAELAMGALALSELWQLHRFLG